MTVFSSSTLVLNADGLPLSLLPVSSRTWQKALQEVFANKAQVLHTYDDWIVRSPSLEFAVPSVIVLNQYRKPKHSVRFTPSMLKLRDGYTCQYCSEVFAVNHLTMDHVTPESHGGKKCWDNIVAACQPCNGRRGNNAKIRPNKEPYKPTYWEMLARRREHVLTIPHESWSYYIDWPEHLLQIRSR